MSDGWSCCQLQYSIIASCMCTTSGRAASAQVVKAGGLIATINVTLTSLSSGKLLSQGTHIKFLGAGVEAGIPGGKNMPRHRFKSKL